MATQIVNKINYNGKVYKLQDSDALPLAGGNVTGPVEFNDSVTMQQALVGDLVITGNASSTNNLQVNTINGVAVGANPRFTDTTYNPVTTSANGLMLKEDKQFIDTLQIGGRNLLNETERKVFENVSSPFEVSYPLSLYAQDKNAFRVQDEIYTISFDYIVSNIGGVVTVKINDLDEVLLDKGNKYENSINQNITAIKMTYKRTFKITQEQANSINTSFKIVFNDLVSNNVIIIENVKLEYGNMATDYTPSPEELGWEPQLVAPEGDKVQYQGEEVSFNISNKPNVYIQEFKRAGGNSGASDEDAWQGMDTYGKYLFRSKKNGTVYVYDLTEDSQNLSIIDSFQLGSYRTTGKTVDAWGLTFNEHNHAGVLCFTDKKFNNNDEFPLLLVSDGCGSGTKGIDGQGFCYIQRIQRTDNNFTSTTVGVIQLRWTKGSEADYADATKGLTEYFFFPWCQWHYYNGYIYSFGHKRRGTGTVTKKFNEHILTRWHPDILTLINKNATNSNQAKITRFYQGTYTTNGASVSIIDNQWKIEYAWDYLDGCRFYDDKIIATYGHGTWLLPNKIVIFSLASTTAIATIDLSKNPASSTKQMEGCIIYNNKIYLGYNADSMLYLLSFVKNKTGEIANPISIATPTTDGLMSIADKVMLDTMSASYVLNPNLQPPVLAVDPAISAFRTIGILGDSYSSGSFYFPVPVSTEHPNGYSNQLGSNEYTSDRYTTSWGKQLGRMTGRDNGKNVMIYAKGGWTAKKWYQDTTGSGRSWGKFDRDMQPKNGTEGGKAKDLYIIAFGINDYREIVEKSGQNVDLTYDWGDPTDITNYSNITDSTSNFYYLKAPNTFFGVYNKIIRNIKRWTPDSIIIILSYLKYEQGFETARDFTNQKLIKIANTFNNAGESVVYIDVNGDPFFNSDFYKKKAYINHHPTVIGHAGMATAIARLISKAMREQPEKFLTLGKIDDPDYIT